MAETYDMIIIGAGIIGSATAYELSKRGYATLNIDMLPAAGLRLHIELLRHYPGALLDTRRHRAGL